MALEATLRDQDGKHEPTGDDRSPAERTTNAKAASGGRAEMLSQLGRRVGEMRALLAQWVAQPEATDLRDELRRRVHALGVAARFHRFSRLSAEAVAAEERLDRAAETGTLDQGDAADLRAAFERWPSLAWGDRAETVSSSAAKPQQRNAEKPSISVDSGPAPRYTALVVGPVSLAKSLLESANAAWDVERTDEGLAALDTARAVAPDVLLVDATLAGARELIEAVRRDPLTRSVAAVVVGNWTRPEEAASFTASGAARIVFRPVSPDALSRVCCEAAEASQDPSPVAPIGELSLQSLGERLGSEVSAALLDGVASDPANTRVDLGRGDDVLGPVWNAVQRIRDVLTIRSRGAVRFAPARPERATPAGGWMAEPVSRGGHTARGRRFTADRVPLTGLRVLVADDDPAVMWFLSGVLRGEGAVVIEANDGAKALQKSMERAPDLALLDVLMPNVDGLSLADRFKADPVLADVPIILLSWKDDLLQRATELGAAAEGVLRKDASGATVIARCRELLWPRARLTERLHAETEAHGRVNGATMASLLTRLCNQKRDVVIQVSDALFLYEVAITGGRPVRASRTAQDGACVRGTSVLPSLLGVRAGRFVVASMRADEAHLPANLEGSLDEMLAPIIAKARGAARITRGIEMSRAARITFDPDWLAGHGALLPEPARSLVRSLAAGASPKRVLWSGTATARVLEATLLDASLRGGIQAVLGPNGEDMLPAAIAIEADLLAGKKVASIAPQAPQESAEDDVSPAGVMVVPAEGAPANPAMFASAAADRFAGAMSAAPPEVDGSSESPERSDIMLDLDDGAPDRLRRPAPQTPDLDDGAPDRLRRPAPQTPDLDPALAKEAATSAHPTIDAPVQVRRPVPFLTLGTLAPPPAIERFEPIRPTKGAAAEPTSPAAPSVTPPASKRSRRSESRNARTPEAPAVKPTKESRWGTWAVFAVAGIVFAVGARLAHDRRGAPAEPQPVAAAQGAPASSAAPTESTPEQEAPKPQGSSQPVRVLGPAGEAEDDPILPQESPMRSDEKVPSGQGLLEVVAGSSDQISIEGQPAIAGPLVKATLAPREKPYVITVKMRDGDKKVFAKIQAGKRTRVRVAPPWNR